MQPNLAAWLKRYPGTLCPMELSAPGFTEARALSPVPWVNDLPRHSFISYRLATTNDENKIAREAGNSPDIIFSNYHETTTEHAAKLYFGIGVNVSGAVS